MKSKAPCPTGKIKFYDLATARVKAKESRKATGDFITPYHCSLCGWWHRGHTPASKMPKAVSA